MNNITRSAGINPGVPSMLLPGGGYEGRTKRLDQAVQTFAEWLHAHIAGPVEIRFNADRLSGLAAVYPGGKTGHDQPEIALGAKLLVPDAMWQCKVQGWADGNCPRRLEDEDWTEDSPIAYTVLIYPQYLRDATNRGSYSSLGPFGFWTVKTPEEAYQLLRELVNVEVKHD